MQEQFDLHMLNELHIEINTADVSIPLEWFHLVRSDDFCNTKWHLHPSIELHCNLGGFDEFTFQDGTVRISENECLLIPPRLLHKRSHLQDPSLLKYSMNFSILPKSKSEEASFLLLSFQVDNHRVFPFREEAKEAMFKCLQEANTRKSGFITVIQSQLLCALYSFAREICDDPQAHYTVEAHRVLNDERYQLIEKYIMNHMSEPLSVHDIANEFNLSGKQLGRIISASSNHASVTSLMQDIRMNKAKELLKHPSLTIAEIATQTGYSSEYYFNRIFRREVGLPPGRYRKSLCGK